MSTKRSVGGPPKRHPPDLDAVSYLPTVTGFLGDDSDPAIPRDVAASRDADAEETHTPRKNRSSQQRPKRPERPVTPRVVVSLPPNLRDALKERARNLELPLGHAFMDCYVTSIEQVKLAPHLDEHAVETEHAAAYEELGLEPRTTRQHPIKVTVEFRLTESERKEIDRAASELTGGNRSALVERILRIASSSGEKEHRSESVSASSG